MSEKKTNRRDFLFTATYAVGAVGVGATIWPMIDQMNPDASVKALASTEVDVSAVNPGKTITVLWRGKPVFIRRRTQDEIAEARSVKLEDLKHPEKDEDRARSSSFSGCFKSSNFTDLASAISSCVLLRIKTGLPLHKTVIVLPGFTALTSTSVLAKALTDASGFI